MEHEEKRVNRAMKERLALAVLTGVGCACLGTGTLYGGETGVSTHGAPGNPIFPSTAFIPDGEPRVFEYNGEKRVFVYGSRDERITGYCGYGHDVWSAPVDDLSAWANHGEVFNVRQVQEIGYGVVPEQHFGAPDCVYNPVTRKYYLYTFLGKGYRLDGVQGPSKDAEGTVPGFGENGPKCVMAWSDSPAGPFVDPVMCDWPPANSAGTFDPAALVDQQEDGSVRVYVYWGMRTGDRCAEVDPTDMHTIIDPETRRPDRNAWRKVLPGRMPHGATLFEASSIRKIAADKYVFIYSPNRVISALTYCWGKTPFGPWHYGGRIVNNANNWRYGNNHGGIVDINGKWYVVYHRQTLGGINRQAMLEPIEVRLDGDRVVIPEVAMSSQASVTAGLPAFQRYNIDICCYATGGALIAGAPRQPDGLHPMTGIKNGAQLGFRYLNFGQAAASDADDIRLRLNLMRMRDASMTLQVVRPDNANDPAGRIDLARFSLHDVVPVDGAYHDTDLPLTALSGNGALEAIGGLEGKLAVYLSFHGGDGELCRINEIEFAKGNTPTPNPLMEVRLPGPDSDDRVVAIPTKARRGESVKLTIRTDPGAAAAELRVRDAAGQNVALERNADVPYGPVSFHFTMPASPVDVVLSSGRGDDE